MSNSTNSNPTNSLPHDQDHLKSLPTKSAQIRYLATKYLTDKGEPNRSAILKVLKETYPNMLYQHVRNVLITPIKKV